VVTYQAKRPLSLEIAVLGRDEFGSSLPNISNAIWLDRHLVPLLER